MPLYVARPWLPDPWQQPVIPLASVALLAGTAITVSLGALRGVRGCPGTSAAVLQEVSVFLWPVVPYIAVLMAGRITWEDGFWHAPLATAAAAFAVRPGPLMTAVQASRWAHGRKRRYGSGEAAVRVILVSDTHLSPAAPKAQAKHRGCGSRICAA